METTWRPSGAITWRTWPATHLAHLAKTSPGATICMDTMLAFQSSPGDRNPTWRTGHLASFMFKVCISPSRLICNKWLHLARRPSGVPGADLTWRPPGADVTWYFALPAPTWPTWLQHHLAISTFTWRLFHLAPHLAKCSSGAPPGDRFTWHQARRPGKSSTWRTSMPVVMKT